MASTRQSNAGAARPTVSASSQRNNSNTTTSLLGTVMSIGTRALALYGAYQLGSFIYDVAWNTDGDKELLAQERQDQQQLQQKNETTSLFSSGRRCRDGQRRGGYQQRSEGAAAAATTESSSSLWTSLLWGQQSVQQSPNGQQQPLATGSSRSPLAAAAQIRRQQLRYCRNQVREVMHRLVPSVLRHMILDATDFSHERRALKELRAVACCEEAAPEAANKNDTPSTVATATTTNSTTSETTTSATTTLSSPPNGVAHKDRISPEQRLWDSLQCKSMTRLLVSIYASSILFVVLTVQVSVIWGHRQDDDRAGTPGVAAGDSEWSIREEEDEEAEDEDEEQEELLSDYKWVLEQTYQYMFQYGLVSLMNTIERIVSNVTAEWNVLDPAFLGFTPRQLEQALRQVQQRLQQDATLDRRRSLLRFVQPPSVLVQEDDDYCYDNELNDNELEARQRRMKLLDETWDVLESPMVEDALNDAVRVLQKLLVHQIFTAAGHEAWQQQSPLPPQHDASMPLAQVLTTIKKTCNGFFAAFEVSDTADDSDKNDDDDNDHHHGQEEQTAAAHRANVYLKALEHLPPVLETMDVCFDFRR